jgi:hypothetical protein
LEFLFDDFLLLIGLILALGRMVNAC